MAEGIASVGDFPAILSERDYKESDLEVYECACFYGLEGNNARMFKDYSARRAAVYVDLGYWGRREGGRWSGYHKVCVNGRHPNAYFRAVQHGFERVKRFHVEPRPWRTGKPLQHILLAGMGDKGAIAEGFRPEEWERWAISEIRKHSQRQIIYRPKPSWKTAKPIEGALYSAPHAREIEQDLAECWAVVTHHSNVAVDAILQGIPAFCWGGVALEMSLQDLSRIESPHYPEGRLHWAADIAYTQWSVAEMRNGLPWRHLKQEALIP